MNVIDLRMRPAAQNGAGDRQEAKGPEASPVRNGMRLFSIGHHPQENAAPASRPSAISPPQGSSFSDRLPASSRMRGPRTS